MELTYVAVSECHAKRCRHAPALSVSRARAKNAAQVAQIRHLVTTQNRRYRAGWPTEPITDPLLAATGSSAQFHGGGFGRFGDRPFLGQSPATTAASRNGLRGLAASHCVNHVAARGAGPAAGRRVAADSPVGGSVVSSWSSGGLPECVGRGQADSARSVAGRDGGLLVGEEHAVDDIAAGGERTRGGGAVQAAVELVAAAPTQRAGRAAGIGPAVGVEQRVGLASAIRRRRGSAVPG